MAARLIARGNQMEQSKSSSIVTPEVVTSAFMSPFFVIYAGSTKQQFFAYAEILSKSPTLRKIVKGKWKDSADRTVNIEDWEPRTIQQLLEWLYTGSYKWTITTPQPVPNENIAVEMCNDIKKDMSQAIDRTEFQVKHDAEAARPLKKEDDIEVALAHSISSLGEPCSEPDGPAPAPLNTVAAREHGIETGCTLLSDAKLYALAHYLQLDELKSLALDNIKDVTVSIECLEQKPRLLNNIVELVRYVYNSTDLLVNSAEPLRHLVSAFAAKWFHALQGSEVDALMAEGGEFVVDLMKELQQNIRNLKAEHNETEKRLKSEVRKYQKRLRKRGGELADDTNAESKWGGASHFNGQGRSVVIEGLQFHYYS
ncbi:MAG: hypothetical protein Q9166_005525 [cf. Caloplaca sp. 2 TL-2023]